MLSASLNKTFLSLSLSLPQVRVVGRPSPQHVQPAVGQRDRKHLEGRHQRRQLSEEETPRASAVGAWNERRRRRCRDWVGGDQSRRWCHERQSDESERHQSTGGERLQIVSECSRHRDEHETAGRVWIWGASCSAQKKEISQSGG